jgi:glyoxylase-like metal-dependent hydrolase (beta-lactamase superfamily II)
MFGAKSLGPVSQPEWLLESDVDITVNNKLVGKALHTPGHSPGLFSYFLLAGLSLTLTTTSDAIYMARLSFFFRFNLLFV